MDGTATAEAVSVGTAATAGRAPGWCDECGYALRGLPRGRPCPECGRVPPDDPATDAPHAGWARAVTAGLVLLLAVTFHAVCTVLIQPFATGLGGSASVLNVPGPKLWAVPLLQRPIGFSPETPGVVGTRTALLGLLAVWLVTAPCASDRPRRDESMRLATRWGCLVAFGLAFGTLLASQGIATGQLQPYRALLVAGVELPGATLLYLYLRRLAEYVPGRDRRQTFDRLAWLVPGGVALAAGMLAWDWWSRGDWQPDPMDRLSVVAGAAYGTIAVVCGVAATAAVASLTGAFFTLAFPRAGRWLTTGRMLARRAPGLAREIPAERARRAGVAAGAVLLVLVMVLGNDLVLWMTSRHGLGGNLPFVNFPGPKVWAGVSLSGGDGRSYWWDPLLARSTFLFLHVIALWLVTIRPEPGRDDDRRLRRWVRWLPTVCIGAGVAVISVFDGLIPAGKDRDALRTEVFALVTILLEVPATVLLYVLLARAGERLGQPRLARAFQLIGVAVVLLVSTSFAMFVLSRRLLDVRRDAVVLGVCAAYGAAAFATAAWATGALLRLAAVLVTTRAHGGALDRGASAGCG